MKKKKFTGLKMGLCGLIGALVWLVIASVEDAGHITHGQAVVGIVVTGLLTILSIFVWYALIVRYNRKYGFYD